MVVDPSPDRSDRSIQHLQIQQEQKKSGKCIISSSNNHNSPSFQKGLPVKEVSFFVVKKLQANLGYLYENMIAQTLASDGRELYYHTFLNESSSKHNYEIDFIFSDRKKIIPIEVKSSGYKKHSSLDAFSRKFSSRISRKILTHIKDYQNRTHTRNRDQIL